MIQGQTLTGIADAIRAQLGTEQQYTPESMAAAIGSIQGGGGLLASILDRTISGVLKLPGILVIGESALFTCTNISGAYIPECKAIGKSAFFGCSGLSIVFLSAAKTIQASSFGNSGIASLIIDSDSIVTLSSTNAFSLSPIGSGTGYIYVSDALVDQYKVATNWATYANQIKGKSELPAEVQQWLDQQGGAAA